MTDPQPKPGMRWIVKREIRVASRSPKNPRGVVMWAVRGYVPLPDGKRATTPVISYYHRLPAAHDAALVACRRKYGRSS